MSSEVDGGNKKTHKSKTKRKGLDRSSTFKGRGEDKKEKDRGGGSEAVDSTAHQQLVACALGMRDNLEDILVRNLIYMFVYILHVCHVCIHVERFLSSIQPPFHLALYIYVHAERLRGEREGD